MRSQHCMDLLTGHSQHCRFWCNSWCFQHRNMIQSETGASNYFLCRWQSSFWLWHMLTPKSRQLCVQYPPYRICSLQLSKLQSLFSSSSSVQWKDCPLILPCYINLRWAIGSSLFWEQFLLHDGSPKHWRLLYHWPMLPYIQRHWLVWIVEIRAICSRLWKHMQSAPGQFMPLELAMVSKSAGLTDEDCFLLCLGSYFWVHTKQFLKDCIKCL